MALESAIFKQKVPSHIFRQQTHQISLFASLNTLNSFFLYKTQKQPIMSLSSQFQLYFTFFTSFTSGQRIILCTPTRNYSHILISCSFSE